MNPDQVDYIRTKNFLLWAVGITGSLITIMTIVAICYTFQDREAARKDFSDTIKELKAEAKENKLDSKAIIDSTQKWTQREIAKIKYFALNEISQIKVSANDIALAEATRKVREVFRQENVDDLIKSEAKLLLENNARVIFDEEIEKNFVQNNKINDWALRFRMGHYDSFKNYNFWLNTEFKDDYKSQQKVRELFRKISWDYDSINYRSVNKMDSVAIYTSLQNIAGTDKNTIIKYLIEQINDDNSGLKDLNDVCFHIKLLSKITDKTFYCFEIEDINSWYAEYQKK